MIAFLEKNFVPIAAKIGSQRHLIAIRNGFVSIMPLMIVGSMAVLINNLPIKSYQKFMMGLFGEGWTGFGGNLWMGSFAVMSLFVAFSIAYNLGKSYDKDGLSCGIISLACLMAIMNPAAEAFAIPYTWTGAQGLFITIIVALLSTEIFVRLIGNEKLVIKMPDGVPPAVARSFAALFPSIITLSIFAFIKLLFVKMGHPDIHQFVFDFIQAPMSSMANTVWSAMIISLLNHLLWFFGLHGSNILEPVMQALYMPAIEANAAAFQAGLPVKHIVTKPFFDAFVYMGGSGVTVALLTAIYIAGKRKHMKNLANLSIAPALFNINEPVMFGLPIVLNPVFIIPFILTPFILTLTSYGAIAMNLVPKTVVFIPWTTPPIIGGILATGGSFAGGALALINLLIAVAIYIPFIIIAEKAEEKKEKEAKNAI